MSRFPKLRSSFSLFSLSFVTLAICLQASSPAFGTISYVVRPPEVSGATGGSGAAASPSAPDSQMEEDPAKEVEAAAARQAAVAKGLNGVNPLSTGFGGTADAAALEKALGERSDLLKILKSPKFQKFQGFVTRPEVSRTITQLMESPDIKRLPWIELGWAFLIMTFTAWKARNIHGFFRLLLFRSVMAVVLLGGSMVVIPWATLGEPYRRFMTILIQAV